MWWRSCGKTYFCVNNRCFDNSSSAGRYLLELSSRGEAVTVTRRLDTSDCLNRDARED